jgi:RNA polymerase-binding transcription factor DksA
MDRKSIGRLKKSLETRHRELRVGVVKTQREMLTAQHDYGKDEGDRANTSLAKEMQLGHKSRDRAILGAVEAALSESAMARSVSASTVGRKSTPSASRLSPGCAIASHARN